VAVPIENPLAEAIEFTTKISDSKHFSIVPDVISLGPYSQSSFQLQYCPSNLGEEQTCHVDLIHPDLGLISFIVVGQGLLPGIMNGINIIAPIREIGSSTIMFRNPFEHPLPIDVILSEQLPSPSSSLLETGEPETDASQKNPFSLLLRKSNGIVLAPESVIQIGVSFNPEKLGTSKSSLEVRSTFNGRSLLWCFPIVGIAEVGVSQRLPKLSIACKSSVLKEVDIPLIGLRLTPAALAELGVDINSFQIEMNIPEGRNKSLITRSFRVQPLELVVARNQPQASHALRYRFLFEPLKIFNTNVELVISSHQGRWKAEVELDATEPPPDDIIKLVAAVGTADKISFRLTNRFLGYSPFQAYFTAQSSPHFSVSPGTGVLAPFGSSEGTQFIVTFKPREYGTRERAFLIISTEEAQWNYEIMGSYPELKHTTNDSQFVKGRK